MRHKRGGSKLGRLTAHRWALWPLPALFAQFCRAEGLACLDLAGPLSDLVRAGGMPHAPTDSHWSPEGHRLVAQQLAVLLASAIHAPPPFILPAETQRSDRP